MMHQTQDYRKLDVWRIAHQLTLDVYRVTADFPRDELYGLTSQLRRAAASIPTNIAEGCGRGGQKELARFLRTARGSANEVEYQVHLSHDLGYIKREVATELYRSVQQVGRMLTSLIRSVEKQHAKSQATTGR